MYLSRITLDLRKRATAIAVSDRSYFHRAIENSFSGGRQRPIWELDNIKGQRHLVIVSRDLPDISRIQERYGDNRTTPTFIEYDEKLDSIRKDSTIRIHTTVAPIYQHHNGREEPLRLYQSNGSKKDAMTWIGEKLAKTGVQPLSIYKTGIEKTKFTHGGNAIPLTLMTFEGYAKVIDSGLLKETMLAGLGRKKAYGAGLLLAVPAG